ncbi:MAG: hypothetical protein KC776_22765 [Myxococcales bacterium]|nr:hypothetical protein [Myxococcales bacterium]MCB9582280.1 hypothetical protein [Polyangiaceae bacterium]
MLSAPVALAAFAVAGIAVGVVTAGRTRALGVALALTTLALPLLVEPLYARVLLAFGCMVFVVRAIDLARDSRQWPTVDRVWLMFAVFDVRARRRIPRSFELRHFATFIAYATLGALGLALVVRVAPAVGGASGLTLRWLGGAVLVYAAADAANALTVGVLAAGGLRVPTQHRSPIRAHTVRQFWGEHWNLNVQAWFRRHAFLPLARRGHARLGVAAGFVTSALLHFYLVAAPIGVRWALPMAGFFLAQGLIAVGETRVQVARWPRAAQHVWTVCAVLGCSPLFVEPMLRVLSL